MTISIARLSWFELKRLLRSPVFWLGLLGVIGLQGAVKATESPVELPSWPAITHNTLYISEAAAAVMFIAALLPAVRQARYGGAITSPVAARERAIALLAAVVICGAAKGALVWGAALALVSYDKVIGSLSLADLVTPSLIVASGGVAGTLVGIWTRSWVPALVPLLAVPTFVAFSWYPVSESPIVGAPITGANALYTVANVLLNPPEGGAASDLWGVPPLHLVQLLFLMGGGIATTLVRVSPRKWHRITTVLLALLLFTGVGGAYAGQRLSLQGDVAAAGGLPLGISAPERVCRAHGDVTYCSYAGYENWIPYWQEVVDPVAEAVPPRAREDLPTVALQSFEAPRKTAEDGVAAPAERWFLDDSYQQRALAAEVAGIVAGMPMDGNDGECTLAGQGRLPVYIWLSMRPFSRTPDLVSLPGISYPDVGDIALAFAMREAPDATVLRGLNRSWERLLSPDTTSAEAAQLLGIEVTDVHRARARSEIERFFGTGDSDDFPLVEESAPADETAEPAPPSCR
ncbi:hypothetical protein GCM10009799_12400 [Nocardiopsis rhodophaea]|uniref:ABC transporter permease n=1 Tax=Nocardiopsis rhodophaea TaxID=280238 RepID=A0ABN2SKE6_9ACTN